MSSLPWQRRGAELPRGSLADKLAVSCRHVIRRNAPLGWLILALLAAIATGWSAVPTTAARVAYRSTGCPAPLQIGVLPGGTDSRALGVNNAGEVAGWSFVTTPGDPTVHVHAFSW